MPKIQMDVSSENAINIILGALSLINNKVLLNGERYYSPHNYEDLGYRIIEDALAVAVKVLDLELFEGQHVDGLPYIEGSVK